MTGIRISETTTAHGPYDLRSCCAGSGQLARVMLNFPPRFFWV